MASSSFTYLYSQIILFTIFILLPPSSSFPLNDTTHSSQPFKKIYAFGDSYTDTGNTESSTGPSSFTFVSNLPYGMTFFHHPTNRYSDGRLMIDFVAEALSLPYLPPYRNTKADTSAGVNFAVAGSTAIEHEFFVKNNLSLDITPQSLQTQLQWFNKHLEGVGCAGGGPIRRDCGALFDDALIWIGEIGANDYAYTLGSTIAGSTIRELAINRITEFLQVLLNKGAKYIVVQGLPPTGCLPLAMTLALPNDRDKIGCVGSANVKSYTHNLLLQSKLKDLRKMYPHAVIAYADYWYAYRSIMMNLNTYGLKEPFKACCGSGSGPYNFDVFAACGSPVSRSCTDPSVYINWDGVHLTEAMYKAVSNLVLRGKFCRPPFNYLVSRKLHVG